MRVHVAQPLAETAQTAERAVLAGIVEKAVAVQPGGEPDHLAQTVDDRELPVVRSRDDHMEAVRAEVDRRHDLGGIVCR